MYHSGPSESTILHECRKNSCRIMDRLVLFFSSVQESTFGPSNRALVYNHGPGTIMDPWSWLLGQDFYLLWVNDSSLVHYCIEISCTIMDPVNTISCSIGHDFFVLVGPWFYMRFFKVEKKKLVYNSGPLSMVHESTQSMKSSVK